MNNTQELELRVKNAQKELEEVTRLLEENKRKTERFVPKLGEIYYYIQTDGTCFPTVWKCDEKDYWRLKTNNCFKTEEEAEKYKNKMEIQAEFERLAELSWQGEKIDWKNYNELKYYIVEFNENIRINYNACGKIQGVKFFKSKETLEETIEKIGKENILKYILEI